MDGVADQPEQLPEKRIGDRERREVDTHLRRAHDDGVLTLTEYDERAALCWAARTRSDLEALTRDLPDPPPPSPPPPDKTRVRRRHAGRAALAAVALLFAAQIVGADDAVAIFSGQVVQVAPDQNRIDVGVLFGSVEVVVPDDARVDTGGFLIFGGTDCPTVCRGTGTRPITVDASGGFGSVAVVRASERGPWDSDSDNDSDDD
jgi:hypothetical protein